ncbi:lytic transglycosylase domain-containing protein [Arenibaculum pallidiluteum]|uniref:lytic transglycosylase domain-containing protein n=1 Tax=Arenibaculum pallidiluteum TaxID=2812559 RepID=UPI001F3CC5D9|nr:lytic transglycosylase domain-containing protein [Arenibaculum pallidiluteum]
MAPPPIRGIASALAALAFMAGAGAAGAEMPSAAIGAWSPRFFSAPRPQQPVQDALPDEAACVAAILDAEREAGIADRRLLAMGFTEAGRALPDGLFTVWPWTVTAEGKGRFFPDRPSAVAHVQNLLASGVRSVDVGCLQVNLRWHPDAFPDIETAFDPAANARYAARYLTALRGGAAGDLGAAIGRYHSAQSERQDAYRARVQGNMRWVSAAEDYVQALAALPARHNPGQGRGPAPAEPWALGRGHPDRGRLVFLAGIYANGPARPLLPGHGG